MLRGRLQHACVQVVYGADRQAWSRVRAALRKGEPKDGSVTLVLERRVGSTAAAAAAATPSGGSTSSSDGGSS